MVRLVNIELVQGCDKECEVCGYSKTIKYMDPVTLTGIVNYLRELGGSQSIKTYGIGNSLLHPEYPSLVHYIKKSLPGVLLIQSINLQEDYNRLVDIPKDIDRIILTVPQFCDDFDLAKGGAWLLKSRGHEVKIQYLIANLEQPERINKLVSICNELGLGPLIVSRYLRYKFGYNDFIMPAAIGLKYDDQLQVDTDQKITSKTGMFCKSFKGKNQEDVESIVFDYQGNIRQSLLCNNFDCNKCPVYAEDFACLVSTQDVYDNLFITCAPGEPHEYRDWLSQERERQYTPEARKAREQARELQKKIDKVLSKCTKEEKDCYDIFMIHMNFNKSLEWFIPRHGKTVEEIKRKMGIGETVFLRIDPEEGKYGRLYPDLRENKPKYSYMGILVDDKMILIKEKKTEEEESK